MKLTETDGEMITLETLEQMGYSRCRHLGGTNPCFDIESGVPVAHGMTSFVWSLMGQDANQPLKEIIIRKGAELRTGGEFWWGSGTPLGDRVESVAILNGGTLPALFSALGKQKQAPVQNTYVWNGWHSIRKARHGSIPKHVLVLGGNPDAPDYALVCRCDTELVLGDHGPFDPAQCLTLANRRPPGVSQRAALLTGQLKHPHGRYRIGFNARSHRGLCGLRTLGC
jgi:hypothetical protein